MKWIGNLFENMTGDSQTMVTKGLWWFAILCSGVLVAMAIKNLTSGNPKKGAYSFLLAIVIVVLALLYAVFVLRAGEGIGNEFNQQIQSFGFVGVGLSLLVCNKIRKSQQKL